MSEIFFGDWSLEVSEGWSSETSLYISYGTPEEINFGMKRRATMPHVPRDPVTDSFRVSVFNHGPGGPGPENEMSFQRSVAFSDNFEIILKPESELFETQYILLKCLDPKTAIPPLMVPPVSFTYHRNNR